MENSPWEFSTLSSARYFHSDPLSSPPRGMGGGAAPATAEVLVAGTSARGEAFFPGGEVVKGAHDNPVAQSRSLSEAEREALFKRLHLAYMRRIYQDVAVQAEKEGWSYADFLTLVLAEEVVGRKQTRLQRLTRSAQFPFLKTMDEFDFSLQSTLRLALLGSYLMDPRDVRVISSWRNPCQAPQNGSEYLERTAQNFRNPQSE